METAEPKIIYLQIGDDVDITEFNESDFQTNAISWCWERIFPNDIEYISKSQILALVDEEINLEKNKPFPYRIDAITNRLIELKQKIEVL